MTMLRKALTILARCLGIGAALLALGAAALALALAAAAKPPAGMAGETLFAVERGDSAQSVAQGLEKQGLIRSAIAFKLLTKIDGAGASLKAGTYRISAGMGTREILERFVSGKQALVRVTIPEGYTLGQVASLLDRMGLAKKEDFLAVARDPALLAELGIASTSAEGYLFPDTYLFPLSFTAEGALRTMVAAFRERLALIPEAAALSPAELQRRLILASIVEREYKDPEEAPLMASVFYNRLKIKMALESCATVVYVITERLGKPHPEIIYDRDLKLDDPYNTYRHRDLPPGPISNPGMTALKAAFYPAASKYLYFRVVDAEAGRHHFSTTLEEHIKAGSLYIKKVGL